MKNKARGFTLIEVILVLALIGAMTPIIYSVFFGGQKGFEVSVEQVQEQADHRILRDYLVKELRYVSYIANEKPEKYEIYYSLEIDENKELKKTEYEKKEEGYEIKSESILPIKFKNLNIKVADGNSKVLEVTIDPDYTFTILLENEAMLENEDRPEEIILLDDLNKTIYYSYSEYKIK